MIFEMFHDAPEQAIDEVVRALGGYKVVGAKLKPDMSADAAGRWLHACCIESRAERLTPGQLMRVMAMAHEAGIHTLAAYLMRETGYADPVPVTHEDQQSELQRQFVAAVATLDAITKRQSAVSARAKR